MNNKKQMSIRRALKNPRTRRRVGGTMETHPGEFADPGAARIEALRRIVRDHQYEKIDGQMVDGFTASAIVQLYDALNETNRAKYRAMTVPKMASVAWKFVKNPAHRERVIARAGVTDKKYLSRPSQLSRTTPSKRLRSRRSVNLSAGREGFFPNPKASRSAFMAWAKVDTDEGGFEYGMDHVTPVTWTFGRSRQLPKGRYVWWLPDDAEGRAFYEAHKGRRLVVSYNELLKLVRRNWRPAMMKNPTRKSRSLISLTGQHSGKVYGFAEESDLRLDNTGTLRRAALALANKHHEPIRFERVSVTTLTPRMRENPAPLKIKPEHFQHMKEKIETVLEAHPNARAEYAAKGLSPKRFRWDLSYAAKLSPWISQNVYPYANDEHIDSALRRIVGDSLKSNPAPRADRIAAASKRFTRFTGHRAANVRNLPFPDNPGAALAVGPVLVLGYSATRDGKTENYLHKFTRHAAPLLAASHDGNSLYLLGGKYKFAERGIVDLKPR